MKKLLLFLSFFVLTLFVNGQVWDAVKIGTIDTDSIMKGEVTIWVKPTTDSIDWTYEGVVGVDYYSDETDTYCTYGIDGVFEVGNIIPSIPIELQPYQVFYTQIYNGEEVNTLHMGGDNINETFNMEVEINGIYIQLTWQNLDLAGYSWCAIGIDNPFPPVGETCDIKLKYTLTP